MYFTKIGKSKKFGSGKNWKTGRKSVSALIHYCREETQFVLQDVDKSTLGCSGKLFTFIKITLKTTQTSETSLVTERHWRGLGHATAHVHRGRFPRTVEEEPAEEETRLPFCPSRCPRGGLTGILRGRDAAGSLTPAPRHFLQLSPRLDNRGLSPVDRPPAPSREGQEYRICRLLQG